ncbi:MAG: SDR family oxidoreductase [Gammaproteobacteria bacterium]|jgi:NAD(P)-dependent dehydrogenase (short-subunit alcohol dehydrogenase family)|nr:SDR family oxidoreductase [Gammaproteobacteria bacterium]MBT3870783.1 SDR family oxidoreductase [Gammaproteobacteria bacterium]MBT4378374.1 SDR family oxidoreductase [Gammaproteobacteria bacterium]MBT4616252.1 SDR family oxidoreductase [Gammaproteobacteria bacterium]MBT5197044.1 SDR family oxidoreductase [Gammaproteobacteria bacterium]
MDLGLKGKRVIITGGSRGMGRAIGEIFLREGAVVSFCSRTANMAPEDEDPRLGGEVHTDGVEQAEEKMRALGEVYGSVVDAADREQLAAWVKHAAETMGGIDVVVSNTSALGSQPRTPEGWQRQFDVDIMSAVTLWDNAYPFLKQSGAGAFIQVSTITALDYHAYGKGSQSYGALKGALVNYVCQLAYEYMSEGIRANTVSPGPIFVEGGSWDKIQRALPDYYDENIARQPSGRLGRAEEVADVVAFLASSRSSWVTGENVVIDGGFTKYIKY